MTPRPKKEQETKAIGIRIPVDWYEMLVRIAEEEERSLNSLFRLAIKEFLKRRAK